MLIIGVILVLGFLKADLKNWQIDNFNLTSIDPSSRDNTSHLPFGTGGFAPYGLDGILKSASKCIYAFVGFDAIASTSKNKKRNV
jgi:cationic amino acid transporter 3